MATYRTLLFATDFSEGADKAVEHARSLAILTGAQLHLLHVITELSDQRRKRVPADVINTFIHEVTQVANTDMETFCQRHFANAAEQGIRITHEVVVGHGYADIIDVADQRGADMIIMGTHGKTGLEKMLVGSTAERVVRHASIPVLTVRS